MRDHLLQLQPAGDLGDEVNYEAQVQRVHTAGDEGRQSKLEEVLELGEVLVVALAGDGLPEAPGGVEPKAWRNHRQTDRQTHSAASGVSASRQEKSLQVHKISN
jgi:hypothetical protein